MKVIFGLGPTLTFHALRDIFHPKDRSYFLSELMNSH